MKFIKNTTWQQVFEAWREREACYEGWIKCATEIKGWPDWESWRRFSADQFKAEQRDWQVFEFEDPMNEVPEMLVGPFSGWQNRLSEPNKYTFKELLEIPEQYEFFSQHKGVLHIMRGLPFETELIGLIREDLDKIVCLEGHHRAVAITLAKMQNRSIDFGSNIKIALAHLKENEVDLLDKMLIRGSSNIDK